MRRHLGGADEEDDVWMWWFHECVCWQTKQRQLAASKICREMRGCLPWLPWLDPRQLRNLLMNVGNKWRAVMVMEFAPALQCMSRADILLGSVCEVGGNGVMLSERNVSVKVSGAIMEASYLLKEGVAAWLVYQEAIKASNDSVYGKPSKEERDAGYRLRAPTGAVPVFKSLGGLSLTDIVGPIAFLAAGTTGGPKAANLDVRADAGPGGRQGNADLKAQLERARLEQQLKRMKGGPTVGGSGGGGGGPAAFVKPFAQRERVDDGFGGDLIRFMTSRLGRVDPSECLGCRFVNFRGQRAAHWLARCPEFTAGNVLAAARAQGFEPRAARGATF